MIIDFPSDKKLELRVKDTGLLDHYDVFVNGTLRRHISDGQLHIIEIRRPRKGAMAIAIHFEGIDGGVSAVIDVTDAENPTTLSKQNGRIHGYLFKAVGP